MSRWIRNEPGRRENALAALVAGVFGAGLAAVVFYVFRLLLAREPLAPRAELEFRSPTVPERDEES